MRCIKKRKINRKKLFNRLFTLLFSILMIFFLASSVVAKDNQAEYKVITIERGDTLWNIIENNYGEDVNIEKAIYTIRKLNDMSRSDLYPGKTLKIPLNL